MFEDIFNAISRSSADNNELRLLRANPSTSRTIGQPTISISKFSCLVISRMMASCWKSFSPKYARVWFYCIKKFTNNLCYSVKVPGRKAPSITVSSGAKLNWRVSGLRIHFFYRWGKNKRAAMGFQ